MARHKIKLITDSASDIPEEMIGQHDITILKIPITIDGVGYYDRESFTNQEFYKILENTKEIPVTSHIPATTYADHYKQAFESNYTDVIVVTLSSTASNMFEAAVYAQQLFFEEYPAALNVLNIHIVDSLSYSMGYGYFVVQAAKQVKSGRTAVEIVRYLDDIFCCVEIYMGVYSLDFAKKSGRVTAAAGFVGEILGLKPIISLIDGETKIVEKIRGEKHLAAKLAELVDQKCWEASEWISLHGDLLEPSQEAEKILIKKMQYEPVGTYSIGPCIAINSGPKVIGFVIIGKKRRQS